MKFFFSLAVPLLLLFAVVTYNNDDAPEAYYDYPTFTEFHHECEATAAMGNTCSANCQDVCSCACSTGIFSCVCSCTCGPQTSTEPESNMQITIPSAERWNLIQDVIASEGTDVSSELVEQIKKLHVLGQNEKILEFSTLATAIDKKIMSLQGETLDKLIEALS